ncbi:MAG: ThiF family adenylyltransferase, partial [Candidatus Saccharimonadales bacterium]
MSDNRYSCQVKLPGFGKVAQAKLAQSRVLVVGLGGLGCPAASYLAAAGVGELALVDFDRVSTSNLHRQTLYGPADVGKYKVEAATRILRLQNPQITINPLA